MVSHTKAGRRFLPKPARLLRIIIIQAVLTLVLLELVGRLFDPLGISYFPETARYLDSLIREEPIGYRNRPGLTGRYYGVEVRINSLGLRDREIEPRPAEDEFRIMVLGDSVPFGVGVSYEDSIPHRLEETANREASGPKRYRTINMGVPSYNTEQELIQLRDLGLGLNPDLVLLLYARNDMEHKLWVFGKRSKWWINLGQRSYAVSLLYQFVRRLKPDIMGRQRNIDRFNRPEAANPGWLRVERSLGQIQRLCRERNIPFAVAVRGGSESVLVQKMLAIGQREGFHLLTWRFEQPGQYQNSATDGHANPLGCRIIAETLHRKLRALGLLNPAESTSLPHHASPEKE